MRLLRIFLSVVCFIEMFVISFILLAASIFILLGSESTRVTNDTTELYNFIVITLGPVISLIVSVFGAWKNICNDKE